MYLETPVRIRIAVFLTEMFLSNMGVRQGCPHSPTAFAMYMQKRHDLILDRADSLDLPQLLTIIILLLLFADDIALFSRTAAGLQRLLDIMDEFCIITHMLLNTDKTIVVVFNPKEKVNIPSFTWRGIVLRRELSAVYLEMLLAAMGKFHQAKQERIAGAVKMSHSIHSKALNRHNTHTIPIVQYYKSSVLPKLLYASAV